MADIRPFLGFRFDPRRAPLSRALCPPYDVIDSEQAEALRRDAVSAVHLELPQGEGEAKYQGAARVWDDWRAEGLLAQDARPGFYVVEERFKAAGKARCRRGFLAALSVRPENADFVLPHERTLAKPKEDRLRLLSAVRANISPIFGIFPDSARVVRRALQKAALAKPVAQGRMKSGVAYRLWVLDDPKAVAAIVKAVAPRQILIADGHHRYEVSRAFYEQNPSPGAETVLAYLCPEEDPGLVVLPTHRIVDGVDVMGAAERQCRMEICRSRLEMLKRLEGKKNPYSFGLYERGTYSIGVPKDNSCASGLCVEWIGSHLLGSVAPDRIRYTPDAAKAMALAQSGGVVVFVKPMAVPQIRKAVRAVGLLPPKSTYFFPKIATGLAFKSLA